MKTKSIYFWVIEAGPVCRPLYLNFYKDSLAWTFDIWESSQFQTKEVAESMMGFLDDSSDCRAAEHCFDLES